MVEHVTFNHGVAGFESRPSHKHNGKYANGIFLSGLVRSQGDAGSSPVFPTNKTVRFKKASVS